MTSRTAFTLLEVILVLALMVILATMAAVNLRGGFAQQRLRKAADQVRTEWARARNDAIKSGRVQVFYHAVDSNRFFHASQASFDDSDQTGASGFGNASTAQGSTSNDRSILPGDVNQTAQPRQLADGVVFLGADVRIDQKSAVMLSQEQDPSELLMMPSFGDDRVNGFGDSEPIGNEQWGTPIYFFPDGSSSNARIVIRNMANRAISIYLRGLTGMVRVGQISDVADESTQQGQRQSSGMLP